ncbi:MAG: hypothetical protein M3416_10755, partial [Acidobacteriota bacterium]|nr:hypothetical protein [Acidobacteriota bacterium]
DARAARAAWAAWDACLENRVGINRAIWWSVYEHIRGVRDEEIEKALGVWLPCVDAYEAGLWLFWVLEGEVVAVPRPAMLFAGDQLHCESGPAVHWPGGEAYYYLHGVRVAKEIVETPATLLDPRVILKEENAEVRREVVRKVGVERVLSALGAERVESREIVLPARAGLAYDAAAGGFVEGFYPEQRLPYELLLLDLGDGRRRPYLKMLNPSVPGVYHVEGVGGECRSVMDALHWRKPLAMQAIPVSDDGDDWWQQGDVYIWPSGAKSLKPLPAVLT